MFNQSNIKSFQVKPMKQSFVNVDSIIIYKEELKFERCYWFKLGIQNIL